ncbi:MAG: hypothetical protein IPJ07_10865 [Acidobacteria bacterium]|nr:hypothetical protein [Acidobacteriota bacterium]
MQSSPAWHYRSKDDKEFIGKIREMVSELPAKELTRVSIIDRQEPRPPDN